MFPYAKPTDARTEKYTVWFEQVQANLWNDIKMLKWMKTLIIVSLKLKGEI